MPGNHSYADPLNAELVIFILGEARGGLRRNYLRRMVRRASQLLGAYGNNGALSEREFNALLLSLEAEKWIATGGRVVSLTREKGEGVYDIIRPVFRRYWAVIPYSGFVEPAESAQVA